MDRKVKTKGFYWLAKNTTTSFQIITVAIIEFLDVETD